MSVSWARCLVIGAAGQMPMRVWFVASGDGVVLLLLLVWDGRRRVGEVSGRGRVRHVASSGSSADRRNNWGIIVEDLCVQGDRAARGSGGTYVLGRMRGSTSSAKLAMSPERPRGN